MAATDPDELVHVIVTTHRHESETGIVEDERLNAEQGWFATAEAAQARVEQLNAVLRRAYEADEDRRVAILQQRRDLVLQHNREAAILRDNGIDKADMAVPREPSRTSFENWMAAKVPISTHSVRSLTRSEHDALTS